MPRRKTAHSDKQSKESELPRIRPQEQLLMDVAGELPPGQLLCNTAGRGQFARAFVQAHPGATADVWFLDVYQRDQAQHAEESSPGLNFLCQPDPPEGPYDVVAWAFGFRGETELKREMLQAGFLRLKIGGRYAVSTDDADDQWLHTELKKLFDKVTRRPLKEGVLYLATKTEELAKRKSYDCEFAFRDRERLLYAYSRPSVFSHRRIDPGARTLINVMEIEPGFRVLDLGCGAGTVGLAALARNENVSVLAMDCNPRALEAITRGAAKNELTGLSTTLDATGTTIPAAEFDLVLANPPYFSNYRIASLFLQIAQHALKPRGRVLVVTKTPLWFEEHMPEFFPRMSLTPVRDYVVASAEHRPRR